MSEENKAPETSRYMVMKRLRHNGKQQALGTTLELTDEEAKPLLALGVIVATPQQAEPAKDAEPEGDPKGEKASEKSKAGGKNAAVEDKEEK